MDCRVENQGKTREESKAGESDDERDLEESIVSESFLQDLNIHSY